MSEPVAAVPNGEPTAVVNGAAVNNSMESVAAAPVAIAPVENSLKRPLADDDQAPPEAKKLHVEPALNGPSEAPAELAPAGAAEEGVKQEVNADAAAAAPAAQQPAPAAGAEVKAEQQLSSPQQRSRAGVPLVVQADAGVFKLPADAILKQEIPLPRRMASCVIGIKGGTVSKLRRESGSKIHVRPSQSREELDQVVEIEGSIEAVLTCVRLIDTLVRGEDPNFKMTPKPAVTARFLVLPEMIGPAIIGKGGTHAKHIKERTGVRIEVIPAQDASSTRQEIVLHGPAERVREAYHLLLGNIRKYGPNLPSGAVPNPLPFPNRGSASTGGRGRGAYSPGGRGGGAYGGGAGRGAPPPPPPPRAAAAAPYRYDYPAAAYAAADPYRAAPGAVAAAPYAAQPPPPAAVPGAAPAAYPSASTDPAMAAAGGSQMMYILQDGVLKPLTVMYQQQGAAAAAQPAAAPAASVLPTAYTAAAAAPTATYAAPAAPASTGGTAALYQQAATTATAPAATAQYTYALPSADASAAATWQVAGQVAASAPMAAAPTAYATTGYGVPAAQQYAAAPAATQYYYQQQ